MQKNVVCGLLLIWQFSSVSFSSDEIKTSYPVILIPGLFGFAGELPFNKSYWGDLPTFLREKGAIVFIPDLSPANGSDERGEQLMEQIKEWQKIGDYEKFHFIGHSQGGKDARYILRNHPHVVASITTIATPHDGTIVADVAYAVIESLPLSQFIWFLGDVVAFGIWSLSHHYHALKQQGKNMACQIHLKSSEIFGQINTKCILNVAFGLSKSQLKNAFSKTKESIPQVLNSACKISQNLYQMVSKLYCDYKKQDFQKAIKCLTTEASQKINQQCPLGITEERQDFKLFSFGTYIEGDNNKDIVGMVMGFLGWFFFNEEKNDGVVGLKSMTFGKWLGERSGTHHLIAANNALGTFRDEEITWFRNIFLILFSQLSEVSQ